MTIITQDWMEFNFLSTNIPPSDAGQLRLTYAFANGLRRLIPTASMARVVPMVAGDVSLPVLTSPELGLRHVANALLVSDNTRKSWNTERLADQV